MTRAFNFAAILFFSALFCEYAAGRETAAGADGAPLPPFLAPEASTPPLFERKNARPAGEVSVLMDAILEKSDGLKNEAMERALGREPAAALEEIAGRRDGSFGMRSITLELLAEKMRGYLWLKRLDSTMPLERAAAGAVFEAEYPALQSVIRASRNSGSTEIRLACTHYSFIGSGRGYLGISYGGFAGLVLNRGFTLPGCRIQDTIRRMPAERAGMQPNDLVVRMNHLEIESFSDLVEAVAIFGPGQDVLCTLLRSGAVRWFRLRLARHFRDTPKQ